LPGDGCLVFEHSPVEDVTADPLTVKVGSHTISARFVVILELDGKHVAAYEDGAVTLLSPACTHRPAEEPLPPAAAD
jgi:hypothetical protein